MKAYLTSIIITILLAIISGVALVWFLGVYHTTVTNEERADIGHIAAEFVSAVKAKPETTTCKTKLFLTDYIDFPYHESLTFPGLMIPDLDMFIPDIVNITCPRCKNVIACSKSYFGSKESFQCNKCKLNMSVVEFPYLYIWE